ncbi:hypothetical protein XELAEV_18031426mg, partial [Xenopus laevis]
FNSCLLASYSGGELETSSWNDSTRFRIRSISESSYAKVDVWSLMLGVDSTDMLSYHNPHTMSAIPKSQYLRARCIASTDAQYKKATNSLTKKLSKRGYHVPKLQRIENDVDVTQKKQQKKLFWGSPKKGTYPCLNCICCSSIIKGDTVCHPTKGNAIRLRDFCTCETKNGIYMLKCPCGLAYIGQTSRAVKERIKEHRGNIRNFKTGTQSDTPVSRHFASHGHNHIQLKWLALEHVKLPKRGGNLSKLLLQREALWIKKLNTMSPMGLWSLSPFL